MPFQTRNPYYLRVSERNVVPVYLYLDERHLEWMSDPIFQHVLADLRPLILSKMRTEGTLKPALLSKKATVETYRGDNYQLCYFFRRTEPHSLILKARNFVAQPLSSAPPAPPLSPSKLQRRKRRNNGAGPANSPANARKKRKIRRKAKAQTDNEDSSSSSSLDEAAPTKTEQPHRSSRHKRPPIGAYQESGEGIASETEHPHDAHIEMGVDVIPEVEEQAERALGHELRDNDYEEKPKLKLQLTFQGFEIYGYCLCIVVEPWPPIRVSSQSFFPQSVNRVSSDWRGSCSSEKMPLFLPDPEQEKASSSNRHDRPPTLSILDPSFLEDSEDSDTGGMRAFSQALNATGDNRPGAADDDEDADTTMFFGDADEVKEL